MNHRPSFNLLGVAVIWQILTARRLAMPTTQINGDLLDRTIERGAQRWGAARLELQRLFSMITTKSEVYRPHHIADATTDRITMVGEMEFELIEPDQDILDQSLRGGHWADTPVLLADTLGEMNIRDTKADLVFIGASLVPHGGHNVVEPLTPEKSVTMGDCTFDITFPAAEEIAAGAPETFPDVRSMKTRIATLLRVPEQLAVMTRPAKQFIGRRSGASQRSFAALTPLMTPS